MSSRDHPFNRSTRPLLERKHHHAQPQLLSTKKKNILPTVQQQASPKMGGFNDFHFVPKLHAPPDLHTYYSGYPYGSPPSPTGAIGHNDFVFSDDSGVHSNDLSQNSTASSTNPPPHYENDYADLAGDNDPTSGRYSINRMSQITNGSGLYQTIGQGTGGECRHPNQHTWGVSAPTAEPRSRQYVSVEATKGPFIFGVDTNGVVPVDRFHASMQRFNNNNSLNSVIHNKLPRGDQQQVIKTVSV